MLLVVGVLQTTAWSRCGHQSTDPAGNVSTWGGHVRQDRSCCSTAVGQLPADLSGPR